MSNFIISYFYTYKRKTNLTQIPVVISRSHGQYLGSKNVEKSPKNDTKNADFNGGLDCFFKELPGVFEGSFAGQESCS